MRGNHPGAEFVGAEFGSIPACAGEPDLDFGGDDFHGVYPRVCGGTICTGAVTATCPGSIPACAGEP